MRNRTSTTVLALLAIFTCRLSPRIIAAEAPAVIPPDDAALAAYLGRFDPVYLDGAFLRHIPEAIPLGNGRLGATMKVQSRLDVHDTLLSSVSNQGAKWPWFSGGPAPITEGFRLQLDRQDAFAPQAKDFKANPRAGHWKRHYFGDMVLTVQGRVTDATGRLDLWNATGTVRIRTTAGSIIVRAFILSDPDVIVIHRTSTGDETKATWRYEAHDHRHQKASSNYAQTGRFGDHDRPWDTGVAEATRQGDFEVRTHPNDCGGKKTVVWHARQLADGSELLVVSHKMSIEGPSLQEPLAQVEAVLELGDFQALRERHAARWHALWRRHFVSLPDARIANAYHAAMYRYLAQFRPDGTMGDDSGQWPNPWGQGWPIQTLNFNVQVQVSPGVAANLADHALPLVNAVNNAVRELQVDAGDADPLAISTIHEGTDVWLSQHGDRYRGDKKVTIDDIPDHFSAGSNLVAKLIGKQPGGREGPANLSHLLWEYYRYYRSTMEEKAGRRLFKLAKMNMRTFLYHLGAKKEDGKYHLPPFCVPERSQNTPDSAYGLAAIQMLCRVILELDERWSLKDPDRALWQDIQANLADYPQIPGPVLLRKEDVSPTKRPPDMEMVEGPAFTVHPGRDQRTAEETAKTGADGYRHWTHLYQIYPYHLVDGFDPAKRTLIRNSVRLYGGGRDSMGSGPRAAMWCHLGDGDTAREELLQRDGAPLHWTFYGSTPLIESPLMMGQSIQNFFLQSHWGTIRVFPAIPADWADAAIHQMRAQGAFLVSAKRSGGQTRWIRIVSKAGEPCRVRTDLARPIEAVGARAFTVTEVDAHVITIDLKKGETVLLKTQGATPDMTIGPVTDDGWINWLPYRYGEEAKAIRMALPGLIEAGDEALVAAINGGDLASLIAACHAVRLRTTRPGTTVRDALTGYLQRRKWSRGVPEREPLIRALTRWERDAELALVFGTELEACQYPQVMVDYVLAAATPEDRIALLQDIIGGNNRMASLVAVDRLVTAGRIDAVAAAMAAAKGRVPIQISQGLQAACADHADQVIRMAGADIIGKHLDQDDTYVLGHMLIELGRFGAEAAPYLDQLKAIDVSRDPRWLGGVPNIIKSIEAKVAEGVQ